MSLILAYTAAALVATVLSRRLLAGQWWRFFRTLLVGTLILLLGDAVAEERSLWTVPGSSGLYLLKIPIETVLIIASSLVNSLLLYLLVAKVLNRASRDRMGRHDDAQRDRRPPRPGVQRRALPGVRQHGGAPARRALPRVRPAP